MSKIILHEGRLGNLVMDSRRTQRLETQLDLTHDTVSAQRLTDIVPVQFFSKYTHDYGEFVPCTKLQQAQHRSNEFLVQHMLRHSYLMYASRNGKYNRLNLHCYIRQLAGWYHNLLGTTSTRHPTATPSQRVICHPYWNYVPGATRSIPPSRASVLLLGRMVPLCHHIVGNYNIMYNPGACCCPSISK